MAGWLHGVFVGDWLFVFPLCGFSLLLFCNYYIILAVPGLLCLWRGCIVGVWFVFVRSALLLAVVTCIVLSFGAMPCLGCFLRVTHWQCHAWEGTTST